jgi:hypothetical protein
MLWPSNLGGKGMTGIDAVFGRWLLLGLVGLGLAGGGCGLGPDPPVGGPVADALATEFNSTPRLRYGKSPTLVFMGKQFIGGDLGTHGYHYRASEGNGVLYTCRAGHIDTTHLRIAADWTAHLAAESYQHLLRGDPGFSFRMIADRHSPHYVQITYPADWASRSLEQRRPIAREVALTMGPYLAYTLVTWHEILTWYGYKSVFFVPEFHSAFSWEDSFSNLLGTYLAAQALRDTAHCFDEAMTIALDREVRKLGVQPAAVAKQVSASVQYQWYSGSIGTFINMKKRGLDIGVETGYATPILVPNVPNCPGAEPLPYPAPTLQSLPSYGFSAVVEIKPHEWEKSKILRIVYPDGEGDRIVPEAHFALIMRQIRREAAARYGPDSVPREETFAHRASAAEPKPDLRKPKPQ